MCLRYWGRPSCYSFGDSPREPRYWRRGYKPRCQSGRGGANLERLFCSFFSVRGMPML